MYLLTTYCYYLDSTICINNKKFISKLIMSAIISIYKIWISFCILYFQKVRCFSNIKQTITKCFSAIPTK